MIQTKNDQDRFTAERVLRTRPKTYRAIVLLLADPGATVMHIAKRHRVSEHTVRAIRAREAVAIAERKQGLASIFANVAEISAERMEELAGQANLRDAGITAGIATDKLIALVGEHSSTVRHIHSIDLSESDIIAFAVQRSKAIQARVIEQDQQVSHRESTSALRHIAPSEVPALPDAEQAASANTRNRNPRKH